MNAVIMLWAFTGDSSCICKSKIQYHSEAVFCIAFSPKTALLAAGSGDNRISLMRYDQDGSAHVFHELLGHSSWVLSLGFHPSAQQLCSGAKDFSIR
jgi:ribosome assembly protein 4